MVLPLWRVDGAGTKDKLRRAMETRLRSFRFDGSSQGRSRRVWPVVSCSGCTEVDERLVEVEAIHDACRSIVCVSNHHGPDFEILPGQQYRLEYCM